MEASERSAAGNRNSRTEQTALALLAETCK
jgi:hypothetical protein